MKEYATFNIEKVGPQTWDFYLINISPKVLNTADFAYPVGQRFCRVHELERYVRSKAGHVRREVIYRIADPKPGEVETAFFSKEEAVHSTFYRRAQLRRGRPSVAKTWREREVQ